MYKMTLTPIITVVLIGLLVAFADAAKIEELVPVNSLLYTTISDLNEIWDEATVSESWQSMFNSDEVDGASLKIDQVMEVMRFTIGTDLRGIVEIFGRQIAFVIMPPQSGKNDISMALILDTGGSRKEAEDIISKVSTVMTMNGEKANVNANFGRYKKISYGKVTLEERTFRYGFIDDLLVIGLKEGGFKTVVDTYRKKAASISRDAKFKNIRKKFANVQIFGYVNVNNALPILKANKNSDELEQTLQSKGLNFDLESPELQSVDVIGFGMDVFSVDGLQKLYIQMKRNPPLGKGGRGDFHAEDVVTSGLLNSMFRDGKNLDFLLPLRRLETFRTSDVFFAMSLGNLNALWQFIVNNNDLQETIRELENTSGLDFETEILRSLTGEIAVSANISDEASERTAGSIPWDEIIVLMGLKERTKWEAAVDAIQQLTDTTTQSEYNYKGATIRELSLPPNESFNTFGYGLTDEVFIAADSTSKIQNIIDNTATVKKSKEADNLLKELPAPPSLLLNLNLDKLLPYTLTSAEIDLNLGACQYTVSPTSDGLWMCFRMISGKNLIDSLGDIVSVVSH